MTVSCSVHKVLKLKDRLVMKLLKKANKETATMLYIYIYS